ncbi:hypothetical protein [Demequina sp. SO4-18]|uniref:hypothetical protein n=1 Tax=Demequina sp. SO4-18 TaxID=3401026 RepID=UPI003B5A3F66
MANNYRAGRAARLFALTGTVSLMALGLTSCSSEPEDDGVLSLDDSDTETAAETEVDQEAQALEFSQCMRDNGVDFPDPTVDADGDVSFEDAFGAAGEGGRFEPGDDSFMTAMEACGDLIEGVGFGPGGGGAGGGEFDQTEIQDALFEYTECLRAEGLDVGDIEFGMGGGPGGGMGGEPGEMPEPGEGPAGGPPEGIERGGFDRLDMFAEQLGYDADDPAWIAANEVCESPLQGGGMGGGGE